MNLDEILRLSPEIRGYGGGKWAMYSTSCCWWTSFPDDLGALPPAAYDFNKKQILVNPLGHRLPCCPHCHSLLMQAPLGDFIKAAVSDPAHYGLGGIKAFEAAHSRNASTCHRNWDDYQVPVDQEKMQAIADETIQKFQGMMDQALFTKQATVQPSTPELPSRKVKKPYRHH